MVERLLVIENHPDVARVFSFMLQDRGYGVALAASIGEAKAAVEKETFHLILCDYHVDDGTAIDFIEWLKRRDRQHPPIFCVSGFGEEAAEKCMRAGFDGFIRKPVNLDDLEARLASMGLTRASRGTDGD